MPNPELEVVCLVASQRMTEHEWIDTIRTLHGDEAAHWFAQGMGVESQLERQFQQRIREVSNANHS